MKRLATLALVSFALLAPTVLIGCGSSDADKPIQADAAKAKAEKAAAEKK